MGLFDKFFSLFKKKKDKEPSTDEKEKNKPEEIEEISETISKFLSLSIVLDELV